MEKVGKNEAGSRSARAPGTPPWRVEVNVRDRAGRDSFAVGTGRPEEGLACVSHSSGSSAIRAKGISRSTVALVAAGLGGKFGSKFESRALAVVGV